jgi:hypothetical protein
MTEFVSVTVEAESLDYIGERVWQADDIFHAIEQMKDADLLIGHGGDELLIAIGEREYISE